MVPPNQAEMMVAALRRKGLPVAYLTSKASSTAFARPRHPDRAARRAHLLRPRVRLRAGRRRPSSDREPLAGRPHRRTPRPGTRRRADASGSIACGRPRRTDHCTGTAACRPSPRRAAPHRHDLVGIAMDQEHRRLAAPRRQAPAPSSAPEKPSTAASAGARRAPVSASMVPGRSRPARAGAPSPAAELGIEEGVERRGPPTPASSAAARSRSENHCGRRRHVAGLGRVGRDEGGMRQMRRARGEPIRSLPSAPTPCSSTTSWRGGPGRRGGRRGPDRASWSSSSPGGCAAIDTLANRARAR